MPLKSQRYPVHHLNKLELNQIGLVLILLAILGLTACVPAGGRPAAGAPQTATAPPYEDPTNSGGVENLTILYTNDEHGWMQGENSGGGAANLIGLWRQQEGYSPQKTS
jgi:hypothetical protein